MQKHSARLRQCEMRKLIFACAAVLALGVSAARAQAFAAELQNEPEDLQWIWMGATGLIVGTCGAGQFIGAH